MDVIELPDLFICSPDRRQTGCLCRHYINTDTEISTQIADTRSYKFHNFIIYITILEGRPDDCQCNVLRSDTLCRLTV